MTDTLTLLCGWQSRRMGRDKALLEYHGETLLARHLRLADEAGGHGRLPRQRRHRLPVSAAGADGRRCARGARRAVVGARRCIDRDCVGGRHGNAADAGGYLGYTRDVARCACRGAALTIYDMCKALSHDVTIEHVRLQGKSGGKRDFHRETGEQP